MPERVQDLALVFRWRLLGDREAPAETGGLGLVPREALLSDKPKALQDFRKLALGVRFRLLMR